MICYSSPFYIASTSLSLFFVPFFLASFLTLPTYHPAELSPPSSPSQYPLNHHHYHYTTTSLQTSIWQRLHANDYLRSYVQEISITVQPLPGAKPCRSASSYNNTPSIYNTPSSYNTPSIYNTPSSYNTPSTYDTPFPSNTPSIYDTP